MHISCNIAFLLLVLEGTGDDQCINDKLDIISTLDDGWQVITSCLLYLPDNCLSPERASMVQKYIVTWLLGNDSMIVLKLMTSWKECKILILNQLLAIILQIIIIYRSIPFQSYLFSISSYFELISQLNMNIPTS